jgi:hypothetical protein
VVLVLVLVDIVAVVPLVKSITVTKVSKQRITNLGPLITKRDFSKTKGTYSIDGVRFGRDKGSTTINISKYLYSSIRQLLILLTREPSKGPPISNYLASIYNTPFYYTY